MDQGLGSIHRKKNLFLVKLPLAMKTSQNGNVSVWANLERVDQEKINLIQRSNLRFANILYHVHNEVKLFLIEHSYFLAYASGWAPWNLSCLEFKFDDNRLSYWHKNKIGRIEKKKLLLPEFANFLPCWLAQSCWDSQQGRELAKSGSNKKKSILPILFLCQ